ncbi:gas vesicle protein K [Streptomyces sp. NBC_00841]|uniref:gas vesicle protein K n=1 Tax=Streptomyces sp. NBC_00841 TaxID=2975847 RepID=UPI003FA3CE0B
MPPPAPSACCPQCRSAAVPQCRSAAVPQCRRTSCPEAVRRYEGPHRITTDPDTVERDLIKLVLTLVELLRQLMERQALQRVDAGDLTEEQEERLGATLMILHSRIIDCARYDLSMQDLNVNLGPLRSLLPPPE